MDQPAKKTVKKTAKKAAKKALKKAGPKRHNTEKLLNQIGQLLQAGNFESTDQANAFLATLVGKDAGSAFDGLLDATPQEQAQNLAFDALEAPTQAKSLALTRQALALDPDCVDALVNLAALTCKSLKATLPLLEQAVAAGERSLGPRFFKKNKGDFWGLIETRPYMRARQRLADTLSTLGRKAEAIAHYQALLELNPNDNQGVRELLLNLCLATGDIAAARALLLAYKRDIGAVFLWGLVLERILAGDPKGAEAALLAARKANPHAQAYLTGKKMMPRNMPPYYSLGSLEEALVCADILAEAWVAHPAAIRWITDRLDPLPKSTKPRPAT